MATSASEARARSDQQRRAIPRWCTTDKECKSQREPTVTSHARRLPSPAGEQARTTTVDHPSMADGALDGRSTVTDGAKKGL
ncbi:hypothetical protein Taro_008921 [Colocasia esculenta]|uniref:Uncharacterized protein n=1 Tax=Colocasia esculenta TaxID=4460 RepID=A0A843TYY8_COLES|nr:hypothetical protein [Colocasia esculenta]